jgi:hypothetical protein
MRRPSLIDRNHNKKRAPKHGALFYCPTAYSDIRLIRGCRLLLPSALSNNLQHHYRFGRDGGRKSRIVRLGIVEVGGLDHIGLIEGVV